MGSTKKAEGAGEAALGKPATAAAKAGAGKGKAKKEKVETPKDRLKARVADELGLLEKLKAHGWGGLSAAETGRIGGYMAKWEREGLIDPDTLELRGRPRERETSVRGFADWP